MATEKTKKVRTTLSLECPEAKTVSLTGDFNNWDPKKHVMKKNSQGVWIKTMMLSPGRYEYKFFVDGEWWNDPQNGQTAPNTFGTINNVLTV